MFRQQNIFYTGQIGHTHFSQGITGYILKEDIVESWMLNEGGAKRYEMYCN